MHETQSDPNDDVALFFEGDARPVPGELLVVDEGGFDEVATEVSLLGGELLDEVADHASSELSEVSLQSPLG